MALHMLYWILDAVRWVVAGCYNGRGTKKVENH